MRGIRDEVGTGRHVIVDHDRVGSGSGLAHPFLRTLDSGLPVVACWTGAGRLSCRAFSDRAVVGGNDDGPGAPAVLELQRDPKGSVLTAVGEPARLGKLLERVADDLSHAPDGVTITRGTGAHAARVLAAWGLTERSEWDRMATDRAPETSAEVLIEPLDPARDREAIMELLAVSSPTTAHGPDQPRHAWCGVRDDDGTLVAVGASLVRTGPDGPFTHLGGIATRPGARGRGLATAVTARLTADGIAEHGLVTLGMFHDNAVARRVYERLGFRVIHEVETWRRPLG